MNLSPTRSRRTVMLEIQTAKTDQQQPDHARYAGAEVITCIQMISNDGMQVTEAVFYGAAERDLLRGFWGAVQTDDVFYGYRVVDCLDLLRQRAWTWGLIPSREIDLRKVYRHDTVNTAVTRSSADDAGYRRAEALAHLLGLPEIHSSKEFEIHG